MIAIISCGLSTPITDANAMWLTNTVPPAGAPGSPIDIASVKSLKSWKQKCLHKTVIKGYICNQMILNNLP